jgi:uncharacterized protein YeaO (DUF488 family)
MTARADVRIARIYDPATPGDGARVLVDRLWPRGVAKADAGLDEWCKEIAPSAELRTWYAHDPAKYDEFRERYLLELTDPVRVELLDRLRALARPGPLTLLTSTKAIEISHLAVLAEQIRA